MKFRNIISLCVVFLSGCTAHSRLYEWEKDLTGMPQIADAAICYGGHSERNPYLWTPERFGRSVTYVDESGSEHWLFDNFIMMELWTDSYNVTYSIAADGRYSSRKEHWQQQLDYWFDEKYGFSALDECISSAAGRIGQPPSRRGIIFSLPDPVYFEHYSDAMAGINRNTVYWGSIDGVEMDFSKPEDRIKAYIWMVDQVRHHFHEAEYDNIELIGFYVLSEELSFPGGFRYEYKEHDVTVKALADYCHSVNEGLFWVPYAMAPGCDRWKELGFDQCIMQPNRYWKDPQWSWDQVFKMLEDNDLGMELEFEGTHGESQNSSVLGRLSNGDVNPYAGANRARFMEYLTNARSRGIYGRKPFVLYSGTNALYELAVSDDAGDREIYHKLCRFIIDNPLKSE